MPPSFGAKSWATIATLSGRLARFVLFTLFTLFTLFASFALFLESSFAASNQIGRGAFAFGNQLERSTLSRADGRRKNQIGRRTASAAARFCGTRGSEA